MHRTKIETELEFWGHSPCRGAQPPKMWHFAESQCVTQM